jgi:hypothetical protein
MIHERQLGRDGIRMCISAALNRTTDSGLLLACVNFLAGLNMAISFNFNLSLLHIFPILDGYLNVLSLCIPGVGTERCAILRFLPELAVDFLCLMCVRRDEADCQCQNQYFFTTPLGLIYNKRISLHIIRCLTLAIDLKVPNVLVGSL